jgi:hypothetical protein
MARVSVGMELIDGDKLIAELQKLVLEVQNKVAQEAIDAGTKPVLTAMIANTPESDGSRRRQSAKTKQRWSGAKKLKTTIKAVVRRKMKYGTVNGAIGLVGPSYSDGGGHGNLFSKDHKRKVLWGRDAGTVRTVNQFVKKTADQTRSAASAAVTSALKSGIEAAANRMAK